MNAHVRQPRSVFQSVAGWAVLLLYLAAASPAGHAMTALLGALDRTHQLQVACSDAGTSLVLHHVGACTTHRHGFAARVLTFFSHSDDPTNPDHAIQFAAQVAMAKSAKVDAPMPVAVAALPLLTGQVLSANSDATVFRAALPRPPDESGQPLFVRSTVLLL